MGSSPIALTNKIKELQEKIGGGSNRFCNLRAPAGPQDEAFGLSQYAAGGRGGGLSSMVIRRAGHEGR
jgi:hypothetical protein